VREKKLDLAVLRPRFDLPTNEPEQLRNVERFGWSLQAVGQQLHHPCCRFFQSTKVPRLGRAILCDQLAQDGDRGRAVFERVHAKGVRAEGGFEVRTLREHARIMPRAPFSSTLIGENAHFAQKFQQLGLALTPQRATVRRGQLREGRLVRLLPEAKLAPMRVNGRQRRRSAMEI
jgi:hypothetical protein